MLTASSVKGARCTGKVYRIRDGKDKHGLFLRVSATGGRSFGQRLTIHGRKVDLGLGGYPLTSLSDARTKALANHAEARSGKDPRPKLRPLGLTFAEAADIKLGDRMTEWKEGSKEPRDWTQTMTDYVFPVIGGVGVAEVTNRQIHEILHPLALSKPSLCKRVSQRIGSVLTWAIATDNRTLANGVQSVYANLPKGTREIAHHSSLPWKQIPKLLAAVRLTRILASGKDAIAMMILTATRTSEVLGMRFDEIDGDVWTIPANRMKGGKGHRIPLSTQALAIVEAAKQRAHGAFVFPGQRGTLSDKAVRNGLASAGYAGYTGHGFRSSFVEWSRIQGVDHDTRERCLAHAISSAVESAYARDDLLALRRPVMQRWADHCVPVGLAKFF